MSEKRFKTLTIIIEDDTGTVQTHIRSELSAPQLMDNIFKLKEKNEQLKEENKKLIEEWEFSFRTEMAHHRFAEKELQEKIREKQATINKLKEENEQLKKARDESDKFIAKKGLGAEFLNWCVAND